VRCSCPASTLLACNCVRQTAEGGGAGGGTRGTGGGNDGCGEGLSGERKGGGATGLGGGVDGDVFGSGGGGGKGGLEGGTRGGTIATAPPRNAALTLPTLMANATTEATISTAAIPPSKLREHTLIIIVLVRLGPVPIGSSSPSISSSTPMRNSRIRLARVARLV